LKITHLLHKCKIPVSEQELYNYLDTIPLKFGIFSLNFKEISVEYQTINLECNLLILTPLFSNLTSYGRLSSYYKALTMVNMDNGSFYYRNEGNPGESTLSSSIIYTINKLKEMCRNYKSFESFIDIKNYFNVIDKRLSCYEIDPNYAKNATKDHFIEVIKKLYGNEEDILQQSINLVDLYLTINAYILNIDVPNISDIQLSMTMMNLYKIHKSKDKN